MVGTQLELGFLLREVWAPKFTRFTISPRLLLWGRNNGAARVEQPFPTGKRDAQSSRLRDTAIRMLFY